MNSPRPTFSFIGFDLDGTLIDTVPSISEALNTVFRQAGIRELSDSEIRGNIGLPVEYLFRHLGLCSKDIEELIRRFRNSLRANLSKPSDVYPGIKNLLQTLTNRGCTLAVATSKPTDLAILTLEMSGLLEHFEIVVGANRGKEKPDPWVLNEVGFKLGKKLDLFIGDRIEDAVASRNAGIQFVAVLNSVHTQENFTPFPSLAICRNTQDLIQFFKSSGF